MLVAWAEHVGAVRAVDVDPDCWVCDLLGFAELSRHWVLSTGLLDFGKDRAFWSCVFSRWLRVQRRRFWSLCGLGH